MKGWLPWFNDFAAAWLGALVRACWQGGLVIGLVWLVGWTFPQLSLRARSWLWRLALLKLLVAFLSPVAIKLPLLSAPASFATPEPPVPLSAPPTVPGAELASAAPASPNVTRRAESLRVSVAGWLFMAWSIGVGACLFKVGTEWRRSCQLRRTCRQMDDARVPAWLVEIGQRMGLRTVPKVLTSDGISQPLLLGPLRPAVVLPGSLLQSASPAQLRMMLAHELAHAKRLDLGWGWLLLLGEALFFFHPLVWLCRVEWRLTQELACDALAVRAAGTRLAEYGAMLLDVSTASQSHFAASCPTTVGIVGNKRNLEKRLKAMKLIRQRPSTWMWMTTTGMLCVATLGALPWCVVARAPGTGPQGQATLPHAGMVAQTQHAFVEQSSNRPSFQNADSQSAQAKASPSRPTAGPNQPPASDSSHPKAAPGASRAEEEATPVPPSQAASPQNESADQGRFLRVFSLRYADAEAMARHLQGRLFRMDDREAQDKLNSLRAQLDVAKAALGIQEAEMKGARREDHRVKDSKNRVISQDAVDAKTTDLEIAQARVAKAEAELKVAEEQVRQAKRDMALLTIHAPTDGTVLRVRAQPGEYVSGAAGQPVLLINP